MLAEKYAPKTIGDFAGNPAAAKEASEWLSSWPKNRGRGLLISGPAGTGKTAFVRAFCRENRLALVESDASELRNKSSIEGTFSEGAGTASLFFRGKIIFFDEADAFTETDRGAAGAIAELIKGSRHPVVLAANDAYEPKLRPIRAICMTVDFGKIPPATIAKRLKEIAGEEKISADEKAIDAIARFANGDLKAAINDFEAASCGRERLSYEHLGAENWRDTERDIIETLKIIFKTLSAENARDAMSTLESPPDEMLQWLRENVPHEYGKSEDVAMAYRYLSRADMFLRRIMRSQYWGYQAYARDLMSVGVAVSKKEKYAKPVKYQYPSKIRRMGQSRAERAESNAFLEKIAPHLHTSKNEARKYIFLFEAMQKHAPEDWKKIEGEIGA